MSIPCGIDYDDYLEPLDGPFYASTQEGTK